MTTTTLTDSVFAAITDWSRPLLTYYDETTGERTELSGSTLGNWAAKTANFLVDEIGVISGDIVRVDLPEHWQTAGILLGAWWSGAHIRLGADGGLGDAEERVVFSGVTSINDHPDADELVVASLDPFALPIRDLPPGVADFGSAVRVHGDQFRPPSLSGSVPDGAVLDGDGAATILAEAQLAAANAGIVTGARVLSTREWHTRDGVVASFLAPLVVGAGLVFVTGAGPDTLTRRADTEKATIVLT